MNQLIKEATRLCLEFAQGKIDETSFEMQFNSALYEASPEELLEFAQAYLAVDSKNVG